MKTYFIIMMLVLLTVLIFPSCVNFKHKNNPEWKDTPNPLDEPGYSEPTAEQLHAKNIRAIRGLPPL